MEKKIKTDLQMLFESLDDSRKAYDEGSEEFKKARALFLRKFEKARETIIVPAMKEIGDELLQRGHNYLIESSDSNGGDMGRRVNRATSMYFFPFDKTNHPEARRSEDPSISFYTEPLSLKIGVHANPKTKRHEASKREEYSLDELTYDAVQSEIVKVLMEVMEG